ncbi:hypothetical protein [Hyphomonas neptunium]|uniref:hypothetical protein n=1 Tax=Hyphomonas neptunium TaxID=81032 RepID=UPI0011D06D77|nr:hypothetical protein [Hyphomonas neptunium]
MRWKIKLWLVLFLVTSATAFMRAKLKFFCPDQFVCWDRGTSNSPFEPWQLFLLCLLIGAICATAILLMPPEDKK